MNAKGGYSYDECEYLNLDYAPPAVQNAAVAEGKNTAHHRRPFSITGRR